MSSQNLITLGGFQFPYNPTTFKRNFPRAVAYQETLSSGFLTDYGFIPNDRNWEMEWEVMDESFFASLYNLYTAGRVSYTLVDDYDNTYTVVLLDLGYVTELPGGVQAYDTVTFKMQVTSGTP